MRWNPWCSALRPGLLVATLAAFTLAAADADPDDAAAKTKRELDNPYQRIIDRNPFHLKDPANDPAANGPTNPPPQSNVKFTGIMRVNGITKACLALVDPTVKPPANPNRYYAIAIGEMQEGVKVLKIDAAKETVKVDGPTGVAVLTFKDNAFQAAGAPPPAPVAPGMPPGGIAKQPTVAGAGFPPTPNPIANAGVVNQGLPANPGYAPGAANINFPANNAGMPASIPAVDASSGLRTIPSRQMRTPGGAADGATTAIIQQATMMEQAARIRAAGCPPPPVPPLPGFMVQPAPAPGGNP